MKLSDQSMGALMMVLQKCLMEQEDIIPMLKDLDFAVTDDTGEEELSVLNPPTLHIDEDKLDKDIMETNA
jgi:hypothetical protein